MKSVNVSTSHITQHAGYINLIRTVRPSTLVLVIQAPEYDVRTTPGRRVWPPTPTSRPPRTVHRVGIPIFSNAPTTSTSSHRAVISFPSPFSAAVAAAPFLVWMYMSEFRK